jgi:hypothetical protein
MKADRSPWLLPVAAAAALALLLMATLGGAPRDLQARSEQAACASPTTTPSVPLVGANTIVYPAGWNLVAGTGLPLMGSDGPLYTFDPAAGSYQTVPAGTRLTPGAGYWAFFDCPTQRSLPVVAPQQASPQLPAGKWVMIGDPNFSPVSVSGADVVYIYLPGSGYEQATTLQPGQGAWAYSAAGGTVTFGPP